MTHDCRKTEVANIILDLLTRIGRRGYDERDLHQSVDEIVRLFKVGRKEK